MAHVAERWGTHYRSIAHGLEVTCIEDPTMLIDAVRKLRPTIWGSVPRIYEKLHAGLEAAFAAERDEVRRAAVQQAIEVGVMKVRAEQAAERGSGPGPDAELRDAYARADELVFSALRAGLGLDRVRWSIVGAAPTPLHILEFFAAIGLPIQELWGMSELSTVATVNPVDRIRFGTVGPPLPGLELKIAPDGEVLVRGATVMRGYRDEPEKTAEAIDADGWLYTGDIGTLDDDGYLKIVDRKKELIINAAGKNMSPANIEAAIKAQSPLIGQAVTVGDGRRFNVALIVLDAEVGAAYAASHHIPDASIASLASNQAARQEVAEAIERGNRSLARVEQIKRFVILDHEWEPGDGQLTPTMKLKRRPIAERYAEEIESLYRR
jgi:long-subunit acyl-CoA synthetase (AMP-forming)